MSRKKLELTGEERRLYNNKKHWEQEQRRKEKKKREAYRAIVEKVLSTCENVGWDSIDLVVGVENEMIEKIVDKLLVEDCFGITFGKQMKIKMK